jgi:hypothetical protein
MADRAILATLPKLNSSNWFEWKKEVETFLLLAGLDRTIDTEDIPTGTKAAEWIELPGFGSGPVQAPFLRT